jgi:hypothetical protein
VKTGVEPDEADELLMPLGDRLRTRRGLIDGGEATWLHLLADFDRHELWRLDGQGSCIDWLVLRTGLAAGTAYEKRRIAQELDRRPFLAEAFDAGEISYSAARVISRLDDPDPAVDARLIDVAKSGTVRDLEALVLRYKNYADQERDPEEAKSRRRGVRIRRGYDGLSTAEITLTNLEIDELLTAMRAYSEHEPSGDPAGGRPVDDSPRGEDGAAGASDDREPATGDSEAVNHSPQGDDAGAISSADRGSAADDSEDPRPEAVDDSPRDEDGGDDLDNQPPVRPAAWQRRADAILDIIRVAMGEGAGPAIPTGADRYLVHLVYNPATGEAQTLDGTPVPTSEVERVLCHASSVAHTYGADGDLLHLGRRTRDWNIHQERAVKVRDGGRCRFPGCIHRICDIHHLQPWGQDGPTDIENGASVCRFHHNLIHHGFKATGNANGTITFERPDGTYLDTTYPLARHRQMAA